MTVFALLFQLWLIIRGDSDMDYQFLEPVLKTCATARVKSVNFTTENAGG